jgi:hypothetical protein
MIFEKTVRCVFALVVSICLLSAASGRAYEHRDHTPDTCALEQAPELPAVQAASRRSTTPFDVRLAAFTLPAPSTPLSPRRAVIECDEARGPRPVFAYTPSIPSRGPPRA